MELALIAFDGLDPRVLYNNRDSFPAFDSVMEGGMHGKWRTPGHTIPSFIATLTGENYPEVNFHWDEGKGNFQRHRQTEMDFLWDVMDSSMSLLNIPVLYPPENIDDSMVCGFLTPESAEQDNLAKPNELQEWLNDLDYVPDVHAGRMYDELGSEMVNGLSAIMDSREYVAEHIIEEYNSDLFYGVWTSTDRWFHQCKMHGEDHIPMYFSADDILEGMLDIIPDDVPTIIFSDHGFAHYEADEGVHKGHMYEGWYCLNNCPVPACRDDSLSIYDLYPTVVNYLEGEVQKNVKGRIIFHPDEQNESVKDRLKGLGYLE